MSAPTPAVAAPLRGELRYSAELARLLAGSGLRRTQRREHAQPVLLVPGFLAGDSSLAVMRIWLRRRGHRVLSSGMLVNVDCAERATKRLERRVRELALATGRPVVLIGQSRGGALARAVAVRAPEHVAVLVTLGSPVRDWLAVSPHVVHAARTVALLGDMRLPGVFSTSCREGECCAAFRAEMQLPLDERIEAVAVHSRSDAIVDWRACLDPHMRQVEVDSSHCGMSVNAEVYRVIDHLLDRSARAAAQPV